MSKLPRGPGASWKGLSILEERVRQLLTEEKERPWLSLIKAEATASRHSGQPHGAVGVTIPPWPPRNEEGPASHRPRDLALPEMTGAGVAPWGDPSGCGAAPGAGLLPQQDGAELPGRGRDPGHLAQSSVFTRMNLTAVPHPPMRGSPKCMSHDTVKNPVSTGNTHVTSKRFFLVEDVTDQDHRRHPGVTAPEPKTDQDGLQQGRETPASRQR